MVFFFCFLLKIVCCLCVCLCTCVYVQSQCFSFRFKTFHIKLTLSFKLFATISSLVFFTYILVKITIKIILSATNNVSLVRNHVISDLTTCLPSRICTLSITFSTSIICATEFIFKIKIQIVMNCPPHWVQSIVRLEISVFACWRFMLH